MGNWKGVKLNVKENPRGKWMLFDLEKDRSESSDLARLHPDLVDRFNEIVEKEHQPAHVLEWEILDNKMLKDKK